ncbi:MAG: hypothetical protein ACJARX_001789 [Psychroserpens sp.]|jgi:hypothetical protein
MATAKIIPQASAPINGLTINDAHKISPTTTASLMNDVMLVVLFIDFDFNG